MTKLYCNNFCAKIENDILKYFILQDYKSIKYKKTKNEGLQQCGQRSKNFVTYLKCKIFGMNNLELSNNKDKSWHFFKIKIWSR